MTSLGAAPSRPRLFAFPLLAAACTSPGSGTITYVYGPDIQDVEDLTFERPSFESCPDPSPYLLPFTESHTVSFSLTEPGPF